jgi:CHAT domain-containing protein
LSSGLHEVSAAGAYIAFAADAGHSASDNPSTEHGLFTGALLEVLKTPGLSIDDVFTNTRELVYNRSGGQQIPFISSGLLGKFVFRPGAVTIDPGELLGTLAHISQLRDQMEEFALHGQLESATLVGEDAISKCQAARKSLRTLPTADRQNFDTAVEGVYRSYASILADAHRPGDAGLVTALIKETEADQILPGSPSASAAPVSLTVPQDRGELMAVAAKADALRAKVSLSSDEAAALQVSESTLSSASNAFWHRSNAAATENTTAEGNVGILKRMIAGETGTTVAIYTIVTSRSVHEILVTPTVTKSYLLKVDESHLNRLVVELRNALGDPRSDPSIPARNLYEVLLGPMEEDLKASDARNLLWSLDGSLRYIPPGALYDGHQYLIERYNSILLSPASYASLASRPDVSRMKVLGVGLARKYEADLSPLPGVQDELLDIVKDPSVASSHGVFPGIILLNDTATEAGIERELAAEPSIVHVATHFILKPGNLAESYTGAGRQRRRSRWFPPDTGKSPRQPGPPFPEC